MKKLRAFLRHLVTNWYEPWLLLLAIEVHEYIVRPFVAAHTHYYIAHLWGGFK